MSNATVIWGFLEHGFRNHASVTSPTQPSPTKTNTAGTIGGQALKLLTMGNSRVAADKSQSSFLTVLGALWCFTVNTGTEPKEKHTSCRVRETRMNGLVYTRMVLSTERDFLCVCMRVCSCLIPSVCVHCSTEQCLVMYSVKETRGAGV